MTVHMSDDQYGQLVAQAVRYALGRRSYVVEDTIRAVRAGWDQIPLQWQRNIAADVMVEVKRSGVVTAPNAYEDSWFGLVDWMLERMEDDPVLGRVRAQLPGAPPATTEGESQKPTEEAT